MFEHMKNYEVLLKKVSTWMRPSEDDHPDQALLFVHIFCHRITPYHFEEGDGWMARNFFSGSTLPHLKTFRTDFSRRNNAIPRPFGKFVTSYRISHTNQTTTLLAILPV